MRVVLFVKMEPMKAKPFPKAKPEHIAWDCGLLGLQ
jgi:hypothetical protein